MDTPRATASYAVRCRRVHHRDLAVLATRAVEILPSHPTWPRVLDELDKPPARLRIAGDLPPLDRAIAIVGTRRATPDALALTTMLASDLARLGAVVVSGGAEGIDAAAHRAALGANGLGVAVLAGGLARPYPRAHLPLFAALAKQGAVLSEADDDCEARPRAFLARNRLIAALARAVVVVQAPLRSGALSTAAHARRLGRPVLAVPWSLADPRGEGCIALLAQGARVCRSAFDALKAIGIRVGRSLCRAKTRPPELETVQRAVLDAIRAGATYVDEIVGLTGLSAPQIQVALTDLLLAGLAARDDRGGYRATTACR